MPFAFLLLGALILVTAIRNTYSQFAHQLVSDLTGSHGFLVWIALVAVIGMLGYFPKFETPSRAFLGLIVLAFFLSNKGVFAKFASAIQSGGTNVPTQPEPTLSGPAPLELAGLTGNTGKLKVEVSGSGGSSAGGLASAAGGALG